jgi:hypothetical protein
MSPAQRKAAADKAAAVEAQAQEHDVETASPDTVEREPRRTAAIEAPFNPLSLAGSWALYHSDAKTVQALIVGEPQPGFYLLELYDLISDKPLGQRITKIDDLAKRDDDGGQWAFFDDHKSVREAFKALLA